MNCSGLVDIGSTEFCIRSTSMHWPRSGSQSILEDTNQGGMDFKLLETDLVGILGKLNSVIDLELLNCIRLGLELHLSLLSIYKERLGTPLVHTIMSSNQCKG
jgi:hypothetical protein